MPPLSLHVLDRRLLATLRTAHVLRLPAGAALVKLPTPEELAFTMRGAQRPALQTDIDAIRADREAIAKVVEEKDEAIQRGFRDVKKVDYASFRDGYSMACVEILALLRPESPAAEKGEK